MDLALNFASNGNAKVFLREGWSVPESTGTWSVGPESCLVIPHNLDEPHCLTLQVVGCVLPNQNDPQPLEVIFNDQLVASLKVHAQERFRVQLPAQSLSQPVSEIRFRHREFRIPHAHGLADTRPLAIHFKRLRVQPLATALRKDKELRARPQVLVIGQSHAAALEQAVVQREEEDASRLSFHFINLTARSDWVSWRDGFHYDADLIAEIGKHVERCGAVISMLGGNAHFVHGSLNHRRKFDFVLPGRPDLPLASDAELVPYDMICERARHDVEAGLGLLRLVHREGGRKFHVSAPPPSGDSEAVIRNLLQAANSDLGFRMQTDVANLGAASPDFRLKLWLVYREVTRQACRDGGIEFIDVPPASVDGRGFMLHHLTSDSFHGTEEYGGMVVDQLEQRLQPASMKSVCDDQTSLS